MAKKGAGANTNGQLTFAPNNYRFYLVI
jgi:hypothetical protein